MTFAKCSAYLKSRPLQTKLIALFAGLFTLLCVAIFIAVFVTSSQRNTEQIRYSATQSFLQGQTFVENKVLSAIYASEVIISNRDVMMLITMQAQDVFNACLFVRDAFTYTEQGQNFRGFSELTQLPRYEKLLHSSGQPFWFSGISLQVERNTEDLICLMRVIRAREDFGEVMGVLRVGIQSASITAILQKVSIAKGGITCLVGEDGTVIASAGDAAGLPQEALAPNTDWESITLDGTTYLRRASSIQHTDWQMVSLIPTLEFQQLGQVFWPTLVAWLAPLFVVTILLIWVISRSVTKRVSTLAGRMTRVVTDGDLSIRMEEGAQDEIGKLCGTFNYMVENLSEMAQDRYEQGKAIKQLELKALQAQINPHFLYNTLDLMNWMALDRGAPELAELARTMARFYKLSLGRGRDFVQLNAEVAHVEAYVKIQNSRFGGSVTLAVDVPVELEDLEVLKLVLQPLVENSVMHGLDVGAGKDRVHIDLSARLEGEVLVITVADDGVGMSEEQLRGLSEVHSHTQHGYGVGNIDLRLRLCYGEPYGLRFKSIQGQGTQAILRMPARRLRKAEGGKA